MIADRRVDGRPASQTSPPMVPKALPATGYAATLRLEASPRWRRRLARCNGARLAVFSPNPRRSPLVARGDPVTQTYLPPLAPYPTTRLRRNRRDPWSRKLVAASVLTAGDLIWPVFVHDEDGRAPVPSMPDTFRLSIAALVDAAGEAAALGIPTVAVFRAVAPALKDSEGGEALKR